MEGEAVQPLSAFITRQDKPEADQEVPPTDPEDATESGVATQASEVSGVATAAGAAALPVPLTDEQQQALESVKRVRKALLKRQHIMREVLTSEHQYVYWLSVFQRIYGHSARESPESWAKRLRGDKSAAVLFSSLDSILDWNKQLLHRLQVLLNPDYDRSEVGDSVPPPDSQAPPPKPMPFVRLGRLMSGQAELFSLYGSYADLHESASPLVEALALEGSEEAKSLAQLAAKPECRGQDLGSFLIMPVQRIPRYRMLLGEVLSASVVALEGMEVLRRLGSVDSLHPAQAALEAEDAQAAQAHIPGAPAPPSPHGPCCVLHLSQQAFDQALLDLAEEVEEGLPAALALADNAARRMNRAISRRLARKELSDLADAFVGERIPLAVPGRRLVREGQLVKVCRRTDKTYTWHLLTDALMYSDAVKTVPGKAFKVHRIMRLSETWVEDVAPGTKTALYSPEHAMMVLSRSKSFVIAAKSAEEKSAWMKDLSRTITDAHTSAVVQQLAGEGDSAASALFSHSTADEEEDTGVAGAAAAWFAGAGSGGEGSGALSLEAARSVAEYTVRVRAAAAKVFIPDRAQPSCAVCDAAFNRILLPRHHCRLCGCLCCDACSKSRLVLPYMHATAAQRICDACMEGDVVGGASDMRLRLRVVRGRDLPAMDLSGSSDPYVRVFHAGIQAGQTPVQKSTLNPVWEEDTATFDFPLRGLSKASAADAGRGNGHSSGSSSGISGSGGSIVMEAYDSDFLMADDFMGRTSVRVEVILQRLAAHRRGQQRAARNAAKSEQRSRGKSEGGKRQGGLPTEAPRLAGSFARSLLNRPDADRGIVLTLPLAEVGGGIASGGAGASHKGSRAVSFTGAFPERERAGTGSIPRITAQFCALVPQEAFAARTHPMRLIHQWQAAALPLLPSDQAGSIGSMATPPPLNAAAAAVTELLYYHFIDVFREKALAELKGDAPQSAPPKREQGVPPLAPPKRKPRKSILQSMLPAWMGGGDADSSPDSGTEPSPAAQDSAAAQQPKKGGQEHVQDWWDSGLRAKDSQEWAPLPPTPQPPLAPPLSDHERSSGLFPKRRRRSKLSAGLPSAQPAAPAGSAGARPGRSKRQSFFDFVQGTHTDRHGRESTLGEASQAASRGPPALPPARRAVRSAVDTAPSTEGSKRSVSIVVPEAAPGRPDTPPRRGARGRAESALGGMGDDFRKRLQRMGTAPRLSGALGTALGWDAADLPDTPALRTLKELFEGLHAFNSSVLDRQRAGELWEEARAAKAQELLRSSMRTVLAARRSLSVARGKPVDTDKSLEADLAAEVQAVAQAGWNGEALAQAVRELKGCAAQQTPAAACQPVLASIVPLVVPAHVALTASRSQSLLKVTETLIEVSAAPDTGPGAAPAPPLLGFEGELSGSSQLDTSALRASAVCELLDRHAAMVSTLNLLVATYIAPLEAVAGGLVPGLLQRAARQADTDFARARMSRHSTKSSASSHTDPVSVRTSDAWERLDEVQSSVEAACQHRCRARQASLSGAPDTPGEGWGDETLVEVGEGGGAFDLSAFGDGRDAAGGQSALLQRLLATLESSVAQLSPSASKTQVALWLHSARQLCAVAGKVLRVWDEEVGGTLSRSIIPLGTFLCRLTAAGSEDAPGVQALLGSCERLEAWGGELAAQDSLGRAGARLLSVRIGRGEVEGALSEIPAFVRSVLAFCTAASEACAALRSAGAWRMLRMLRRAAAREFGKDCRISAQGVFDTSKRSGVDQPSPPPRPGSTSSVLAASRRDTQASPRARTDTGSTIGEEEAYGGVDSVFSMAQAPAQALLGLLQPLQQLMHCTAADGHDWPAAAAALQALQASQEGLEGFLAGMERDRRAHAEHGAMSLTHGMTADQAKVAAARVEELM